MNRMQPLLLLLQTSLLIGILGCVHPISHELRAKARQDLTYPVIARDPLSHKGETVIWGGIVIRVRSHPNQTILTILEMPLDYWGVPQGEVYSRGRFIARVSRYLDNEVYGGKKKVTVAGDIVGEETKRFDEIQIRYPVVQVREIHPFRKGQYSPYERSDYFNNGYRLHYDEPSPFHGIH
jgi:starvation-inducible outer membrane lipoprotein